MCAFSDMGEIRLRWWLLALSVSLLAAAYRLTPYHLTASAAVRPPGEVLATADFDGGRALLARDKGMYYLGIALRHGWLWRGRTWSAFRVRREPVALMARGISWDQGRNQVLVAGGVVLDHRITRIQYGDQVQELGSDGHFLFASTRWDMTRHQPAQAFAADGTVLFTMSEATDWEFVPQRK